MVIARNTHTIYTNLTQSLSGRWEDVCFGEKTYGLSAVATWTKRVPKVDRVKLLLLLRPSRSPSSTLALVLLRAIRHGTGSESPLLGRGNVSSFTCNRSSFIRKELYF